MTTNSLQINNSTVFAGLGTASFTVITTGLYTLGFKSTIPAIVAGSKNDSTATAGGSALQVVVNQDTGGGPVAKLTVGGAATNPTPTQQSIGGRVTLQCTAGDVLTVVLTSANAVDAVPNAVKTTINLFQGQ